MLFNSKWDATKAALLSGVQEERYADMSIVLELIKQKNTTIGIMMYEGDNISLYNKIFLPVIRRVYPSTDKHIDPQEFIDLAYKWMKISFDNKSVSIDGSDVPEHPVDITYNFGVPVVDEETVDYEAEYMAKIAMMLMDRFNKEY